MISCRVVSRHVDAHVDGELDTTTQVEFDSHLASCPHCREEAALTRAIKAETKRALGGTRAPDALRKKLLVALEKAPRPSASERREGERRDEAPSVAAPSSVTPSPSVATPEPRANEPARRSARGYVVAARYVVPAAAAAVVFAAFATQRSDDTVSPRSNRALAASMPLFEEVVRRHASEHPAEVRGSEGEVSRWFRGRLGFQARPVHFGGATDAELVGARISNVREQDAAAFYYDVDGHRVTVIVFEPPADAWDDGLRSGSQRARVGDQDVYYRQVRGYTVPVVERDGLAYAFTGDLDSQSMIQLAATATPAN
ncbi:MAG: zf-HC2 domain-containing protein [Sandaracinaceae bacterium]|nr:zf-HC2 domain-containing protein [Sandaracinaceae bacterium]